MSDTPRIDAFLAKSGGELSHAGVKGMKWGVRKKRSLSRDHTTVRTIRKKRGAELNNANLQKAINRINLENQYKKLNPSKASRYIAAVVAAGVTANKVIAFTRSPAGKVIQAKLAAMLASNTMKNVVITAGNVVKIIT